MTSNVVSRPKTSWWRRVKTEPHLHEPEPEIIKPKSLDVLADQIRRCQGRLVSAQCDLARAETDLEDAQKALVDALVEVDKELGFSRVKMLGGQV